MTQVCCVLSVTLTVSATTVSAQSPPEMDWVTIPAGTFNIGCVPADQDCLDTERPYHEVTLSRPFDVMPTEVTVAHYLAFSRRSGHPLPPQPSFLQNGDHPIVHVDWNDAFAFCDWAGGRLLTEAEWEYAARGGSADQIYWWGDEFETDRANYNEECCGDVATGDPWVSTAPVKSFPANGFGLYDMTGNVWEWVVDWFSDYAPGPVTDPIATDIGMFRLARGGSWFNPPTVLRLSVRLMFAQTGQTSNVGIRCGRNTPTSMFAE